MTSAETLEKFERIGADISKVIELAYKEGYLDGHRDTLNERYESGKAFGVSTTKFKLDVLSTMTQEQAG